MVHLVLVVFFFAFFTYKVYAKIAFDKGKYVINFQLTLISSKNLILEMGILFCGDGGSVC